MGIRVHKSIGYTLAGREFKKYLKSEKALSEAVYREEEGYGNLPKWADKNKKAIIKFYNENNPWRPISASKAGQFEWNLYVKSLQGDKEGKRPYLHDHVEVDGQHGKPTFVQVIPIGSAKQWARYDDDIDYAEETAKYHQKRRTLPIGKCGIYPWLGMVRTKVPPLRYFKKKGSKGAKESRDKFATLRAAEWSQLSGNWDPKVKPLAKGELLEHMKKDYRPVIPLPAAVIFWAIKDAFKDPAKAYNALRPMLVVYWA